jgi:hypothetical protein
MMKLIGKNGSTFDKVLKSSGDDGSTVVSESVEYEIIPPVVRAPLGSRVMKTEPLKIHSGFIERFSPCPSTYRVKLWALESDRYGTKGEISRMYVGESNAPIPHIGLHWSNNKVDERVILTE